MNIKIAGTGSYVPDFVLTNEALSHMVETNDEWIVKRTGIKERRINLDKPNWEMALEASKKALENAGISPEQISGIIASTVTADHVTPALSCYVQKELGVPQAFAFDISAGCSGFIYALNVAQAMMKADPIRNRCILVFGSECLSRMTDYEDRSTCILFGDGAGAVVLLPSDDDSGIIATSLYADGEGSSLLYAQTHVPVVNNGDGTIRCSDEKIKSVLKMNGGEILKFTIRVVPEMINRVLEQTEFSKEEIDYFLFHQANLRLISSVKEKFNIPEEKIPLNIQRYGNTSSASIPILLDEVHRQGTLKKGDLLVAVGFGSGLTAASALIRW